MKLVLVEWVDAHAGNGWLEIGAIREAAGPVYCRSVGWMAAHNKDVTMLVPHLSGEKNEGLNVYGRGDLAIPTKSIVKITTLSTPSK